MGMVDLITEHARRLLESVQREILNFVEFLFKKYSTPLARLATPATRQAGLHAGCAVMAADFDAPLSDDFLAGRKPKPRLAAKEEENPPQSPFCKEGG